MLLLCLQQSLGGGVTTLLAQPLARKALYGGEDLLEFAVFTV
jgi:hypothetical protein